MKYVGPTRREIGVRTVFNLLGPLSNPAGAETQVLGVARPDQVELMASVLNRLGSRSALVVHGEDGLDEISLTGPTTVYEIRDGRVSSYRITPQRGRSSSRRLEQRCAATRRKRTPA